ncbi:MAG: ABC transporter ATP-binding protein, partial [Simkaniaceae bacterium]|nr:ABC transporter ATP-binding protein [Simkaniaceae bacterium]
MQKEFVELESEIKKTVVFVTHDIFEAIILGDRIALLDEGKLLQISTPAELVENPVNEFVDQFLGMHRFHLSLLTKTIKEFPGLSKSEASVHFSQEKYKLSIRDTFIDALDLFKISKRKSLPVFSGKVYMGDLIKEDLLDKVIGILMVEKNNNE